MCYNKLNVLFFSRKANYSGKQGKLDSQLAHNDHGFIFLACLGMFWVPGVKIQVCTNTTTMTSGRMKVVKCFPIPIALGHYCRQALLDYPSCVSPLVWPRLVDPHKWGYYSIACLFSTASSWCALWLAYLHSTSMAGITTFMIHTRLIITEQNNTDYLTHLHNSHMYLHLAVHCRWVFWLFILYCVYLFVCATMMAAAGSVFWEWVRHLLFWLSWCRSLKWAVVGMLQKNLEGDCNIDPTIWKGIYQLLWTRFGSMDWTLSIASYSFLHPISS